jgi:hypothetical protein
MSFFSLIIDIASSMTGETLSKVEGQKEMEDEYYGTVYPPIAEDRANLASDMHTAMAEYKEQHGIED